MLARSDVDFMASLTQCLLTTLTEPLGTTFGSPENWNLHGTGRVYARVLAVRAQKSPAGRARACGAGDRFDTEPVKFRDANRRLLFQPPVSIETEIALPGFRFSVSFPMCGMVMSNVCCRTGVALECCTSSLLIVVGPSWADACRPDSWRHSVKDCHAS